MVGGSRQNSRLGRHKQAARGAYQLDSKCFSDLLVRGWAGEFQDRSPCSDASAASNLLRTA